MAWIPSSQEVAQKFVNLVYCVYPKKKIVLIPFILFYIKKYSENQLRSYKSRLVEELLLWIGELLGVFFVLGNFSLD